MMHCKNLFVISCLSVLIDRKSHFNELVSGDSLLERLAENGERSEVRGVVGSKFVRSSLLSWLVLRVDEVLC